MVENHGSLRIDSVPGIRMRAKEKEPILVRKATRNCPFTRRSSGSFGGVQTMEASRYRHDHFAWALFGLARCRPARLHATAAE